MPMPVAADDKQPVRLRSCKRAYWVFAFIAGVPLLLSLAVFIKNPSLWGSLVVCSGIVGLCFLWLSSFQIVLDRDTFSYRSLVGGTISVPWSEIAGVEMKVGYTGYRDQFQPPFRLIVDLRSFSSRRKIVVNMRLLSGKDVTLLLDTLRSKLSDRFKWE